MQGDTMAPAIANCHVDTITKDWMSNNTEDVYRFKNRVPISILTVIDDQVGVSVQGVSSNRLNSHINVSSAVKGLQFCPTKCVQMTIRSKGSKSEFVDKLYVDRWECVRTDDTIKDVYVGKTPMENVHSQKYLGLFIQSNGKHTDTIAKKNKYCKWQ